MQIRSHKINVGGVKLNSCPLMTDELTIKVILDYTPELMQSPGRDVNKHDMTYHGVSLSFAMS